MAHLIVTARMTPPAFVARLAGSGFRFQVMTRRGIELGGCRDHPLGHVVAVADFYKNSNLLIGAKNRIAGVTLTATDVDWTHGTGPDVSGPAVALVMVMTGRKAALEDLTGDGVAVLRQRP